MTETAASPAYTTSFPAARLPEFLSLMERTDRRAVKNGIDPFVYRLRREDRVITTAGGIQITVEYAVVEFDAFRLTLGDFTFVAALVPEEAGYTVHTAPGQSLDGWVRPEAGDDHCDHCNTNRRRTRLYIVRDDRTGKLLQLGHNCIELYTGLEPKGLWVLNFDETLDSFSEEGFDFSSGRTEFSIRIDEVLALSLALTNGGRSYVSRAKESMSNPATVEVLREFIFFPPKPCNPGDRDYRAYMEHREIAAKAKEIEADTDLIAAVRASAETVKAGTDYGDNLRIILAAESGYVGRRNLGILASLVAVYRRNLEQAAERTAGPQAPKGFLAPVGAKVANLTLTIKTVKIWEGDYGTSTFIVGTVEDGHVVVWKASRFIDLEPGDTLEIKSATVKENSTFRETDQTVLTRARVA